MLQWGNVTHTPVPRIRDESNLRSRRKRGPLWLPDSVHYDDSLLAIPLDSDPGILVPNLVIVSYKFEKGVVKLLCGTFLQVRLWVGQEVEENVRGSIERHWCCWLGMAGWDGERAFLPSLYMFFDQAVNQFLGDRFGRWMRRGTYIHSAGMEKKGVWSGECMDTSLLVSSDGSQRPVHLSFGIKP